MFVVESFGTPSGAILKEVTTHPLDPEFPNAGQHRADEPFYNWQGWLHPHLTNPSGLVFPNLHHTILNAYHPETGEVIGSANFVHNPQGAYDPDTKEFGPALKWDQAYVHPDYRHTDLLSRMTQYAINKHPNVPINAELEEPRFMNILKRYNRGLGWDTKLDETGKIPEAKLRKLVEPWLQGVQAKTAARTVYRVVGADETPEIEKNFPMVWPGDDDEYEGATHHFNTLTEAERYRRWMSDPKMGNGGEFHIWEGQLHGPQTPDPDWEGGQLGTVWPVRRVSKTAAGQVMWHVEHRPGDDAKWEAHRQFEDEETALDEAHYKAIETPNRQWRVRKYEGDEPSYSPGQIEHRIRNAARRNRIPKYVQDWQEQHHPGEEHGLASDCINPKCHHDWSPDEERELAHYGEIKCPECGTLQDIHGNLGSYNEDFSGKNTASGLSLDHMGNIGESIVKRIKMPGMNLVHHFTEKNNPIDMIHEDANGNKWGMEVKTNHSEAQPRFKLGDSRERLKKLQYCAQQGLRPGLLGVRLNFYTNQADVFHRPQLSDTYVGAPTMKHIGTFDFSDLNPFKDPGEVPQDLPDQAALPW